MNICGIIAEYNPFHNGHLYQADKARQLSRCDFLVVVMAGNFTQRGDPALVDKWTRTQMALLAGADLVIELPCLYAVRPAPHFAAAGIQLLHAAGATSFCFGSELESQELNAILSLSSTESQKVDSHIRELLAQGKSHARARGEAFSHALGWDVNCLNQPNSVLGIEYLLANIQLDNPMTPIIVKRTNSYHDQRIGTISSASAIRLAIANGEIEEAMQALPLTSQALMRSQNPASICTQETLDNLLLYRLRSMSPSQIANLPDVAEGLEHLIAKACRSATSRVDLLRKIKSKRYTYARLSRILTYALLGIDKDIAAAYPAPSYIRPLGFRKKATPLLNRIKNLNQLPMVVRAAQFTAERNGCFDLECRATDLWGLGTQSSILRQAGNDFTHKMIVIDD